MGTRTLSGPLMNPLENRIPLQSVLPQVILSTAAWQCLVCGVIPPCVGSLRVRSGRLTKTWSLQRGTHGQKWPPDGLAAFWQCPQCALRRATRRRQSRPLGDERVKIRTAPRQGAQMVSGCHLLRWDGPAGVRRSCCSSSNDYVAVLKSDVCMHSYPCQVLSRSGISTEVV